MVISLKENSDYPFRARFRNPDKTPFDFAGHTVDLIIDPTSTRFIRVALTPETGEGKEGYISGRVHVDFPAGLHKAELRIASTDGSVIKYPREGYIQLRVEASRS